ncbi:hypothetical protein C1Y63_06310 [Corynebacterium sp. 13CS0277]|uniref:hypothetical protein n=1 Tax=Corynebacterium sp. 13CS0277 TaxID=2071994 RepID=UPI000D04083F|nr:hypothetical protein [Corynebacterium sp. 13CS0277]PRQ11454.1 hypothetical protein C1Y63_06310 [Corynebacterium sp. 13CS0277]
MPAPPPSTPTPTGAPASAPATDAPAHQGAGTATGTPPRPHTHQELTRAAAQLSTKGLAAAAAVADALTGSHPSDGTAPAAPRTRSDERATPPRIDDDGTIRSLRLASHALVLLRGKDCIQFGMDATSHGILQCTGEEKIHRVAAALTTARTPIGIGRLTRALVKAGMSQHRARTVIADLMHAGILEDTARRPLHAVVLGQADAAQAVAAQLKAQLQDHPLSLNRSVSSDPLRTIMHVSRHTPIILVNFTRPTSALCKSLVNNPSTIIPVTFTGRHIEIGPLHLRGEGPCVVCEELRRRRNDPQWPQIATQIQPTRPSAARRAPTPAAAGATLPAATPPVGVASMAGDWLELAARTAATNLAPLLVALDRQRDAPHLDNHVFRPGLRIRLSPTTWEYSTDVVLPDPRCPDCHDRASVLAEVRKDRISELSRAGE